MRKNQVPWTKRLEIKLLFSILLGFTIFIAIFSFHTLRRARLDMLKHSEAYGNTLTASICRILSEELYLKNRKNIAQIIERLVANEKHLKLLRVFTRDGEIITFPPEGLGAEDQGILYKKKVFNGIGTKDEIEVGRLEVVYTINTFQEIYYLHVVTAFYAAIVFFLLFALLFYGLFRYFVLNPIKTLTAGTTIIASGNLLHTIIIDNSDEIGLLASSFNEMTFKLRTAKEKIQELNKTLENKVHERTRELMNANQNLKDTQYQLVESGKMAAVGLIGMSVAHELNNPLEGIIGYVQLIRLQFSEDEFETNKKEEVLKYLGYIDTSSTRCRHIVDNLLNYSRKTKKEFVPVDVHALIEATLELMEYQFTKWKLKILKHYCSFSPVVMGNQDRLQQVFINLIANAHHAMPTGGELQIKTDAHTIHGTKNVLISFRDTGCGIEKEKLHTIFQSFITSEKGQKNIGLGLSICKQIIKDHRGIIRVESELSVGSTFTIILPSQA
jgi:two-component system, NtrC family, sensor kinase